MIDNNYSNQEITLTGRLAEFRDALRHEIEAIKNTALSSIVITNGHKLELTGTYFVYRFNVEYFGTIPADTPCSILISNKRYDATVINYEELSITLSCKNDLGDFIGKAQLENGSTYLMEKMIQRIEVNAEKYNPAGKRMFHEEPFSQINNESIGALNDLNEMQKKAVESAVKGNITFIWGPPGTGKTEVLSQIIYLLFSKNRSVLLVSHTNIAVDGALEKVCTKLKEMPINNKTKEFPVLRLGTSISTKLKTAYPKVTFESHLNELSADLIDQRNKLEAEDKNNQYKLNVLEWIKSYQSKQDLFRDTLKQLKLLYTDSRGLEEKNEVTLQNIANLKRELDKCGLYFSLFEELKELKEKQSQIIVTKQNYEENIKHLGKFIDEKKNNIVFHIRYKELQLEQNKHLSQLAQSNRIDKLAKKIIDIEFHRYRVLNSKKNIEIMLSKAKNHNAFGRVLLGIDSPIKIQLQLDRKNKQLFNLKTDLSAEKKLMQEYQDEYIITKAVISECDSIELISSEEILEKEIDLNNKKIEFYLSKIKEIDNTLIQNKKILSEANGKVENLLKSLNFNPIEVKLLHTKEVKLNNEQQSELNNTIKGINKLKVLLQYHTDKYNNLFHITKTTSSLEQKLDDMEEKYQTIVNDYKLTSDSIEKRIKQLNKRIIDINEKVAKINERIDKLGDRFKVRVNLQNGVK